MIKVLAKEDWIPPFADKAVFVIAPAVIVIAVVLSFAVIPGPRHRGRGPEHRHPVLSRHVVPRRVQRCLAGWASDSKYSLLGGLRASAQMLSYEVFMGLSLMGVVMLAGSFNLREIVEAQQDLWFVVPQFFGFVVFFIAGIAETHRLPFDLPEAESELVAGYHSNTRA